MEIISYTTSIRDKWDEFVCCHDYAWVGHHSAIFELEKEFGNENISLVVIDDKQKIIGIMPLFFRIRKVKNIIPIQKSIVSGSSLRSGSLFADALSEKQQDKALDLLMSKIMELGHSLKVDDITIAYPIMHGDKTSLEHFGYFPLKRYGFKENNLVTMVKDLRFDEQTLFSSLRHNCRKNIRRCIEEGGEFINIVDRSQWMSCYDLNVQTFNTNFTKPYTLKTMEILWDSFVANGLAEITAIRLNNKIISVLVTAVMKKSYYAWIGFNSKPAPIPGANNLLTWKTMLYHKQKGVEFFEIGSREFSNTKQVNISAYKESFQGSDSYSLSGSLILSPLKMLMLKTLKSYLLAYFTVKSSS